MSTADISYTHTVNSLSNKSKGRVSRLLRDISVSSEGGRIHRASRSSISRNIPRMQGLSDPRAYCAGVRTQSFEFKRNHLRLEHLFFHNSPRARIEVAGLNRGSLLETSNGFVVGGIRNEGSTGAGPFGGDVSADSTAFEKNESIIL